MFFLYDFRSVSNMHPTLEDDPEASPGCGCASLGHRDRSKRINHFEMKGLVDKREYAGGQAGAGDAAGGN